MNDYYDFPMSGGTLQRYEKERMAPGFQAERLQASRKPRVIIVKRNNAAFVPRAQRQPNVVWWHHSLSDGTLTIKNTKELFYVGEVPLSNENLFVTTANNVSGPLLNTLEWKVAKDNDVLDMGRAEQAAFGLALSLVRWNGANKFCSRCGAPTDPTRDVGFSRTCTRCKRQHFPQIMPAVLVAVFDGRGNVILSQRRKTSKQLTLLSGFMLLGETAEETVRREVEEETGAKVSAVRYIGSQPFPYPYLLMLCYYAVAADSPKLVVEAEELTKVVWVSKADVRKALAEGHPDFTLHGPGTTPYAFLKPWVDGDVDDFGRAVKRSSKL
ncbi:Mutt/nudix family protein-like protein [Leptomonas pyrrhocoris]|uniref:Mutt/nudix family protein-like protein n=1 Tax=Leptomonas pyrrhocoris TaxID=157538 RepID=A0A0M9FRT2_LEPPY|nr:Mutt/nudix family protein-like protein [Leptomonas pyrrhocoris]KPA74556.1 Mutt/nudix family protein-like protein [Leptomonas pyrrhocoris]|eukprot:XP_015652995.1 Mutt/nudix family protein-like protein [Leptomonas pyrrhocoris]